MSEPSHFPPMRNYHPPAAPVDVLHRDADLLFINKPNGLLSVPGKAAEHSDCVEARVKAADPAALLVHRLDMDTSGVMVFARTPAAQRHLGQQFERRHVQKSYEAVVAGQLCGEGTVDLPLITDWPNRPLQMVCHKRGRAAVTHWRALEAHDTQTRVELRPVTGRSHQLRVHMLALGHPILGDRFYGDPGTAPRLMLHAREVTLFHPDGGAPLTIRVPVPF